MSKTQLDLFGNLEENPDGVPDSKPAPEAAATPKRPRATKKNAPTPKKTEESLYAKKDWAPLTVKETTVIIEEKTVAIPVVKTPPPPQVEEKEDKVLSVSDLNKYIREILEGRFPQLWLKGEISNFKAHTSGHFYFSLKDAKAQINAVMFRSYNTGLRFRPEDGMEVLVRGKITVYEPRGNYQIFCESMEPVGAGALQKAFEQLKAKLQREGLFDQARKRALPAHPRHIAIVTSPTGAAIRDMLNVLGRRHKGVHITVVPCKVQGDAAPGEIVQALTLAQKIRDVDVIICGRGGGSIEDLWAFNDERVARAIAACRVPTISAVGHEIDFTIADFVADLRAPTPSAAAELVVANAADLIQRLTTLGRALKLAMFGRIEQAREQAKFFTHRLVDPQRMLQDASQRSDELLQRLEMSMRRAIEIRDAEMQPLSVRLGAAIRALVTARKEALARNMAVLDSLSPLKVLDRGFSMVVDGKGKIVTHAEELKAGDDVTVRMCKGSVTATVKTVKKDER